MQPKEQGGRWSALLRSLSSSAMMFACLKLATYLYHGTYYGVPLHWPTIVTNVLVISLVGTLGFLSGSLRVKQEFSFRVIVYIAIFGYFVPYSIVRLLESWLFGPWAFLVSVYLVTMLVTIKLGPRWAGSANPDRPTGR